MRKKVELLKHHAHFASDVIYMFFEGLVIFVFIVNKLALQINLTISRCLQMVDTTEQCRLS